jgi:hypothetical protein
MPKKAIEIRKFTKGMVTNIDVTDPPIDVPIYTKGLETHNAVGSLSGSSVDESILNNLAIVNAVSIIINNQDTLFAISNVGNFYFINGLYDVPYFNPFDAGTESIGVPSDPGVGT